MSVVTSSGPSMDVCNLCMGKLTWETFSESRVFKTVMLRKGWAHSDGELIERCTLECTIFKRSGSCSWCGFSLTCTLLWIKEFISWTKGKKKRNKNLWTDKMATFPLNNQFVSLMVDFTPFNFIISPACSVWIDVLALSTSSACTTACKSLMRVEYMLEIRLLFRKPQRRIKFFE